LAAEHALLVHVRGRAHVALVERLEQEEKNLLNYKINQKPLKRKPMKKMKWNFFLLWHCESTDKR
jgi:hypothetical protein